jgi:hypothetical protein
MFTNSEKPTTADRIAAIISHAKTYPAWRGNKENLAAAQQALLKRDRLNSAAQHGEYHPEIKSSEE